MDFTKVLTKWVCKYCFCSDVLDVFGQVLNKSQRVEGVTVVETS